MMDPDIKAKWLAALRSGNYRQGMGWLRTSNGFCCLGVLCDVVEPSRWGGSHKVNDMLVWSHDGEDCMKYQWEIDGGLLGEDTQEELATMNDDGKPFAEIADYIENEL